MKNTPPGSLERRKQVQVRLRADLLIEPQKYEGRTCYVVKDPVSLRYFRFKDREHFLMQLMDGRHTLDAAQQEYEQRFRPARLTLEEIEGFARLLMTAGLAHNDSPQTGSRLFEQRRQQKRLRWLQAITQVFCIQIPLFDPDKVLEWLLGRLGWMFTKAFLILSSGVVLAALLLIATHFDEFWSRLPSLHDFFNMKTIIFAWAALGAVKVLHELGHGLSCKAFGGEVHEMGVLFLFLFPCLYCNVTDAWTLPSKWRRILISFAGIYVELLIASLACFIWWAAPYQPLLRQCCLSIVVVCSINTLVFNANPFLRYDGYYMLADWLEIPNLRQRANRFLTNVVLRHGLGIEDRREQPMARWRRLLFIGYAIASYGYRWLVTVGVLWLMYRFLEQYRLSALGAGLVAISVASMLGWPLYRLMQTLGQRGRLPGMKRGHVFRSASLVGGLILVGLLVPLPISRIRQTGLVQLQPDAAEKVFVPAAAVLERLYVRDGQHVEPNAILAEFRSLYLETQRGEARSEYEVRSVQLHALQDRAPLTRDAGERASVEVARAVATGERALFARQAEVFDQLVKRLVLRAPRAGVVMNPPHIDDVGKVWQRDESSPFCVIGEPSRLRALMPVSPADYRLLQEESAQVSSLIAAIRVPGAQTPACRGLVPRLPESEANEVPFSLTTLGGGPLIAELTSRPGEYSPLAQHYLVPIDFLEPTGRIYPGTLAQIQIRFHWRPAVWWLWRALASTFDMGVF